MIQNADYDFLTNEISLPFYFGEKPLFTISFKGFQCHADVFANPEISTPDPPAGELKQGGWRIAMVYSYPVSKKLSKIVFRKGYICYTLRHYRRFYIKTDRTFDKYLERFRGKTLSTLRRKAKRVSGSCQSTPPLKVYTTEEEMREFIGIAGEISRKTFQYRLLNQGLQESDEYRNDFLVRADEKRIAGLILYAEDRPVAYNLCPIYGNGVMIYYYTGYDPDYATYSPGTVLQYWTIETACKLDHVSYYDLCTGEGKHKELFADDYKYCADTLYFPINPWYLFIVLANAAYDGSMGMVKFLIRRLGKTDQIKKAIRNRATAG
jgi:hypothetical protein